MKKIKLTDKFNDISIYEILSKLVKKFPNGFILNNATSFLKREYYDFFLPISFLSGDLLYSDYISRENSPRPGPKYKYYVNLDKISITEIDKEKVNIEKIINSYNKIITPKFGEGSLKEELLNDLRLIFKDL